MTLGFACALTACEPPRVAQTGVPPRGASTATVEVLATENGTPEGGDGPARMTLALHGADGRRIVLADRASAFAAFRDGVALVDMERRLLLVTPDRERRVLAGRSGAAPVTAADGSLVYVVDHGVSAEVHVLSTAGRDRVVADALASAGMLAPQADGRLLFLASTSSGVAGVWLVPEEGPARCISNCDLRIGQVGDERHVPLPVSTDAIHVHGDEVEYEAFDGTTRRLALSDSDRGPGVSIDEPQGNPLRPEREAGRDW